MTEAVATISTPHGAALLQALCAHWSRRLEAEYDAQRGRVNFDYAAAHFEATPAGLRVMLAAPDRVALARLRRRFTTRLRKLAAREPLTLDWCVA